MVMRFTEAGCVATIVVFFFLIHVNAGLTRVIQKEDLWKQDEAFISSCALQTQKDLQDSDSDSQQKIQIVCQAKQKFSDCIAGARKTGGQLLEIFRYYRWQENEADVTLNICPNLKFDELKLLMINSDKDDSSPCGTVIFKQCINSVSHPLRNVIEAMYSFLGCVEAKSEEMTCSASLIQHFVNLAKLIRFLLQIEGKALGKEI